jgi:hypothetical protein
MRFLITAAPDPNAPKPAADAPFDPALMAAYMKFNEDMHRAGVWCSTGPSSRPRSSSAAST